MDVSTFYALFSATCFGLVGLWWGAVEKRRDWITDPARRREAAGVYLSFLLPALMGLFAQVGGTEQPLFWRTSFVVVALVGVVSTLRFLRSTSRADSDSRLASRRWMLVVLYGVVAVVALLPQVPRSLGITPLQGEATLLVLLVAVAHALVWDALTRSPDPQPPTGFGA